MTDIFVVRDKDDAEDKGVAFGTQTDAKKHASAMRGVGVTTITEKVELAKLPIKDLYAALFNRETEVFGKQVTLVQELAGVKGKAA